MTPASLSLAEASALASDVLDQVERAVIGKRDALQLVLAGVLAGGHVLIEDLPGLGKTVAAHSLATALGLTYTRAQFTPDLLPSDLTGGYIYDQRASEFVFRPGPVFTGLLLADEINRTPPKTQSALLEAMQEHRVSVEGHTFDLPRPFHVLATANPIEHEGTYPLPEAQLDRFLIKVLATYPSAAEEERIVRRIGGEAPTAVETVLGAREIALLRSALASVKVDDALAAYVVRIVRATRPNRDAARPEPAHAHAHAAGAESAAARIDSASLSHDAARDVARWVEYGASPRASIHLFRCARASALMDGRSFVLPEDVKAMAAEVLRHRVVLSYEAEAEGIGADAVIARVLGALTLP